MAVTRIQIPAWQRANEHDDRLERSVAELRLDVRTVNCLEDAGILTVGQLLGCTSERLLAIKNFGEKTLETVYDALEEIGFTRVVNNPGERFGRLAR